MKTEVKTTEPLRELVALREIKTGRLRVRQVVAFGGCSRTLILQLDGAFQEHGASTIDEMFATDNRGTYEPIYRGDTVSITF
jgi:hypothetical protein